MTRRSSGSLGKPSAEVFAAALQCIEEAVAIFDADERLVMFNSKFAEIRHAMTGDHIALGDSWEDLIRATASSGAVARARGREAEWLRERRALRGDFDAAPRLPDGRTFKVKERHIPGGGLAVIYIEVSELVEAEERLHAAFDAVCLAEISLDDRIVRANAALSALLGFQSEELVGRTIHDLSGDKKQADRAAFRKLRAGEIQHFKAERRLVRKDGGLVPVEITCSLVRRPSGEPDHIIGIVIDVSSRKAAEEAVLEREARLLSILATVPEPLITIDEQGVVESFSRSAEELFGYTGAEVVGQNVGMLMPSPFREEHDGYLARYLQTGERRVIGIGRIVSGRRKDGTVFPLEISVGEARAGGKCHFTGFIRDLTAKQRLEEELRQAQRMEAVGQLTGGIAHDFNNLLTVLFGDLDMLEARITDRRGLSLVREARETAELGAELTARLLAFGRRQPLAPKLTDVALLLEEMTSLLRRTLGETIEVRMRIGSHVGKVLVDPGQFQNAVLNLAINARDAMERGGRLTIAVDDFEIDRAYARQHASVRPGHYVLISVTDTGTGMSPEVRDRAFEPFYTTKDVGAGSGLGLSMVYGFVKQSGGHVQIYSELGHGTTVRLYVPQAIDSPVKAAAAELLSLDAFRAGGETVLLVEDEPKLRRMTVIRLKDLGYRVLDASNGPAALALVDAERRIDLLFTDMVMPGGMTGADLVEAARERRPGLKVVITSGYAEPELLDKGIAASSGWLRKPYTMIQLAQALREALDG